MAEYDGSIRIGVMLDDEKVKKKLETLRANLTKQTKEVDAQARAVARLQAQYDKLKEGGEPRGVKTLESSLKRATAEAAKLDQKFNEINQLAELDKAARGYVSPDISSRLEEARAELQAADLKADQLGKKLADLKASPQSAEEAKKIASALEEAKSKLQQMQMEASGTAERIQHLEGVSQSWPVKLAQAVSRMGAVIKEKAKSSGSAISTLRKKISGLGREKGFNKAGNSAAGLTKILGRLKKIAEGAFFFRIIGRQLRALVSQIGKYLTANKDFSNALSGLKSNLLTAFQPVYEAVIPALTAMMEAMEAASAKFAAFIASVFGTTASKAQENAEALYEQANATEETGEAAKKAQKNQEKYLASFDTIEKLGNAEKEEKKPTSPKFDTDFSQVQPPQWLQDFWAPIKESWDQVGTDTIQAAKNAFGSIWDLLKSIGRSFLDLWNSPAGLEVLTKFHILLQTILGIIHDIAAAFITAWNSGTGEQVIQALFFMLSSVLDLLISIGQSFREAWNDNGRGVEICNTILEIIRNVFEIVGNLADQFRKAWEANNNGVVIWGAILDIIHDVLSFFERITSATAEWAKGLDFEPIVSAFRAMLEAAEPLVDLLLKGLSWAFENILLPLGKWVIEDALPASIDVLTAAFDALYKILNALGPVFSFLWKNVLSPIAFFIGDVFVVALNALADVITLVGDLLSGLINDLTTAASKVSGFFGFNSGVSGVFSAQNSRSFSPTMAANYADNISALGIDSIPRLAKGAVISPNSEFLAILGDQRNGTNIEAPLSTITEAIQDALGDFGGYGEMVVNVNFTGTLSQLVRALQPQIQVETRRLGPNLLGV